jgi:hypothetical protein
LARTAEMNSCWSSSPFPSSSCFLNIASQPIRVTCERTKRPRLIKTFSSVPRQAPEIKREIKRNVNRNPSHKIKTRKELTRASQASTNEATAVCQPDICAPVFRSRSFRTCTEEKRIFLSHLYIKNDDFTKTGSGQT